ncbi:hypothetical protein K402DRAFT_406969 [Aulographum hederae CBS 113979]|uniref:C2H2-type domain-containing protein n=1 Tax=Aulographum hederae CBS 113979 TaxID=1176131 RepID=A0A6G1GR54_9PEZI|nr:hypothetical protein K402DRAFT_406969 [Aulographum hederae CBS 113979]
MPGGACHLVASLRDSVNEIIIEMEIRLEPKIKTLANDLPHRVVRESSDDDCTDSPASFELGRWWLDTCEISHKEFCNRASFEPSRLPSRVIDVGELGGCEDPRLVDGRGIRSLYLTLSYCWGRCQTLITTTENLADHQKEHASEVSGGCFAARDGLLTRPHSFERLDLREDITSWNAYAAQKRTSPDAPPPLTRRAWVYQEQMLSPRVLYYSSTALRWHCATGTATKDCPDFSFGSDYISHFQREMWQPKAGERISQLFHTSEGSIPTQILASRSVGLSPPFIQEKTPWHEIIEEFTRRQLSRETDRLAALQGIADAIIRGDLNLVQYAAGLWRPSLCFDLIWSTTTSNISDIVSKQDLELKKDGAERENSVSAIAPSWSWAARPGVKAYPFGDGHHFVAFGNALNISIKGSSSRQNGVIKLEGVVRHGYISNSKGTLNAPCGISIPTADRKKAVKASNIDWLPDYDLIDGTKLTSIELVGSFQPPPWAFQQIWEMGSSSFFQEEGPRTSQRVCEMDEGV